MTGRNIAGILFVILGQTHLVHSADQDLSQLTLERIITNDEFRAERFGPARWLQDGTGYTTIETNPSGSDIVKYDPGTGQRSVLVSAKQLTSQGKNQAISIQDYVWSNKGDKLLIFTNTKRVWRQNSRGDYWVLDRKNETLRKLGGTGPEATLMFAKFSPDATRVGYVRAGEIYIEDLSTSKITRLTNDGSTTRINGTFDWVYEEEFSIRDGFRWSPDGRSIAYWQIDTEGLQNYTLINTTETLYPKLTSIPYPKVGQTNPAARIGVVAADGGTTSWVEIPGDSRNFYLPRMEWIPGSNELILQHLNRLQNANEVMIADAKTGKTRIAFTDKDEAWVDIVEDFNWFDTNKKFTWMSERDGWRHIYAASRSGENPQLITKGEYDVIEFVHVDETNGTILFLGSPENPTQSYLFSVKIDGSAPAIRLTPKDQVGTHNYQISHDGRWAIHTFSTFSSPPIIDLISLPDHKSIRTLADNSKLRTKLKALKLGSSEFFRIGIGEGVELDGWKILPPDFQATKKYPMMVHVYGEPAGQTVLDRWNGQRNLWHLMLAQKGYVVVSVDNRGTPAPRGRAWRKSVYKQIGILASKDQAAAVRAVEAKWPFIDPSRVGVWGWSGGGSMSLNAIFRYPDLYKAAIAIAFISDQKLYDTIYQERYMGLPDENAKGYREGSPINFVDGLKGELLIIHGTGDDNCHYQSCERLVDRLIAANKPFSMLSYPNRTHSISEGKNTTRHLFESMTRFLERNLPAGPRD
jgi:dipeptidyl-peptidase-4